MYDFYLISNSNKVVANCFIKHLECYLNHLSADYWLSLSSWNNCDLCCVSAVQGKGIKDCSSSVCWHYTYDVVKFLDKRSKVRVL